MKKPDKTYNYKPQFISPTPALSDMMNKPFSLTVERPKNRYIPYIIGVWLLVALVCVIDLLVSRETTNILSATFSSATALFGITYFVMGKKAFNRVMHFEWLDDGIRYWQKRKPAQPIDINFDQMKLFRESAGSLIIDLHSKESLVIKTDFVSEAIIRRLTELSIAE